MESVDGVNLPVLRQGRALVEESDDLFLPSIVMGAIAVLASASAYSCFNRLPFPSVVSLAEDFQKLNIAQSFVLSYLPKDYWRPFEMILG